ncbi:MAG: hypothetical protein HYZ42_17165 [Bacteroidetes bacterium]|nr:hypothetical protein [Bacteroidota bacterium]
MHKLFGVIGNVFQVESCSNSVDYRFGYNGMEKDPEMKGDGNSYTTEFRQYDPRLGRWASLDPLKGKFPDQSPYSAFNGNPVLYNDPTGESGEITITKPQGDKPGVVRCTMDFFLYGTGVSGLLEAGISNQDLTDQMLSVLGNVKTIKVNGVDYEVVWDVTVSYVLDDATAREMILGSPAHPMVLDASQNYLRIESFNQDQKDRGDANKFVANAYGKNQGNVSEMTEVEDQIGSNTGFLILSEIIKDKTVLPHEGIHNVGLKHEDTDYIATEPDLMTSPGQPVINKPNTVHSDDRSFPNMKEEFIKSNGGIDVIDVVNKRVFTQDNFIDALEKNGFTINGDRTGIEVVLPQQGDFTRDFGKPDNTYYNAEGRMTTPAQDRGGR